MAEPIKILIVDNDEEVLIALERTLEGEGYSTTTAWSGREALILADRIHFDLLLVDEYISDCDGLVLCEELLRRQPGALPFLLYARKGAARRLTSVAHPNICKWEHNELKAQIRRCFAA